MINHAADNSSLFVGRLQGVELRIHILAPLTALVMLLAAKSKFVEVQTILAGWTFVVLILSVTLHELLRSVTAVQVGGHTSSLVIGPLGGLTKLHLPVDPPAHLMTAIAGPIAHIALILLAGGGLAFANQFAGDGITSPYNVVGLLLNPCSPEIASLSPPLPLLSFDARTLTVIARLTIWVNWCLLLISLLPVDPCAGAELLRGILWPIVGRATAITATSRIALGSALFFVLLALIVPVSTTGNKQPINVPEWFPLTVISVFLLYGGYHNKTLRRYDVGLAIDEFDSDDEQWLISEWDDHDREAVLVEHLQDKQQEAIDRKRREHEANEDERVDAILERLRDLSFDQLSEEDRATLKRASRRYRERRESQED